MANNIIKIDFTTPTTINMDDNVSLRDLYEGLLKKNGIKQHTRFNDWIRRKTKNYTEGVDFTPVTQKTTTGKGGSGVTTSTEYYCSVQVAMEILANGHGRVGHEMRQFMSSCVRKVIENKIAIPPVPELLQMALDEINKEKQLRLDAEKTAEFHRSTVVQLDNYMKNQPVKALGEHGLDVTTIIREYPEVVGYMQADYRDIYWTKKYGHLNEPAKVSTWLLTHGKIAAMKRKTPFKKHYVNLFSRMDIERFLSKKRGQKYE